MAVKGVREIRRFFAQIFGFRFCCPTCGQLNTLVGKRSRSSRFNRISGHVQCSFCRTSYYAGVVLWKVKGGGGTGGHPDQTPTAQELAQIRGEIERDEVSGRFVPKKVARKDLVNRVITEDRELDEELDLTVVQYQTPREKEKAHTNQCYGDMVLQHGVWVCEVCGYRRGEI
jgi:hypothetical protein